MKILDEKIITNFEAKKIIEERKKEKDLNYEQKITIDFLEKSCKITKTVFEKLVKQLSEIQILKPRHVALLINNLPMTEDEVKQIFAKERTNLKKDEIKKIVEIMQNTIKKKK
ncbi:MAG: hypothetical protein J7J92_03050 [Candidatus Aenigmarchaeota archaeon]|nr:hypothetical protein [Candidatus Aenigmarchaeota archaeon]